PFPYTTLFRSLDAVDGAAADARSVEQRLDLLFGRVGKLLAVAVEELDAVVLGWVVGCGDHATEIERQQRDRRGRQHSRDDRVPAGRRDSVRERLFELDAGRPRVAADEDPAAAGPVRTRTAQPLHQLGSQICPDDAANAVGPEVA